MTEGGTPHPDHFRASSQMGRPAAHNCMTTEFDPPGAHHEASREDPPIVTDDGLIRKVTMSKYFPEGKKK